jgi:hypothetical protein
MPCAPSPDSAAAQTSLNRARSTKRLSFAPSRHRYVQNLLFRIFILLLSALTSSAAAPSFANSEIESKSITIDTPLTPAIVEELRHRRVNIAYINRGADENVFDDPTLFSHLATVVCNGSEERNNRLVAHLSTIYPRLSELQIEQHEPLSAGSVSYLKRFKHLSSLILLCDIQEYVLPKDTFPDSLEELILESEHASQWSLPEFPNLKALRLYEASANGRFLRAETDFCESAAFWTYREKRLPNK